MEDLEHHHYQARILEKFKSYEGLRVNPDFIKWQAELVTPRIEFLRDEVLTTNRVEANWKERLADRLVAYQEAVQTYEVIFGEAIDLAKRTRLDIKKLEEGEY